MSDLEGWARVVEDDNDQEEEEATLKLKKKVLAIQTTETALK
jgi:hypothetical protein